MAPRPTWLGRTFPGIRYLVLEVLVALSLAFLVWLYARSRDQDTLDDMPIPVQIALAPGTVGNYELEIEGSSRVPVSFTGPPSRIRELRHQLQRGQVLVHVTLAVPEEFHKENVYHEVVRIEAEAVPVPPGVLVVLAEGRNAIPVTLHKLAERHLPVRLDYSGEARLSQVKLEPATVRVRGPKELLDRARFIATQPYTVTGSDELAGTDGLLRGQVSLLRELEGRPVQTTPGSVTFRFRVHPRQKLYELADVPITFLCPPDFPWRPRFAGEDTGRITLHLLGPASEDTPGVQAFVDLTQGNFGGGRNLQPVRLQLPKDFQLAQEPPRRIAFVLEPVQRGAE